MLASTRLLLSMVPPGSRWPPLAAEASPAAARPAETHASSIALHVLHEPDVQRSHQSPPALELLAEILGGGSREAHGREQGAVQQEGCGVRLRGPPGRRPAHRPTFDTHPGRVERPDD